jgi:acetoin utilization deacetylase AcuC-like enzyme
MRTGIFFHYQQGERLKDFPDALEGILEKENVFFYDAFYPSKPESNFDLTPLPTEALYRIHTHEQVERVKAAGVYEGAILSASGTYSAALRIWSDEITNAFVFTGYGDHHAGRDHFGGGCYFNGAAIAIGEVKARRIARRFAIIDTDAHHGDGTWELFANDSEVLYLCLCSEPFEEINYNVNLHVSSGISDNDYVELVEDALSRYIGPFGPELLFWNWGYDGTTGEYGDMGLSPSCHLKVARLLAATARELCKGRLIVVLCGGSCRELACQLIPKIIRILARQDH